GGHDRAAVHRVGFTVLLGDELLQYGQESRVGHVFRPLAMMVVPPPTRSTVRASMTTSTLEATPGRGRRVMSSGSMVGSHGRVTCHDAPAPRDFARSAPAAVAACPEVAITGEAKNSVDRP